MPTERQTNINIIPWLILQIFFLQVFLLILVRSHLFHACHIRKGRTVRRSLRVNVTTSGMTMEFYQTVALPCLMYGSETRALRTDWKTIRSSRGAVTTVCTVWDTERRGEISPQLVMGQLDRHMKGRGTGWNIYRGCHQKGPPSNVFVINR
jgi:hypothetical protein